jgi:uncharacterized protein
MMRRHGVEVNVLTTVNRESARHPLEVYRFIRDLGVQFIQFIPVIERRPEEKAEKLGIPLAPPPALTRREPWTAVTPWSVEPEAYGDFLIGIYDEWIRSDVGRVFVMNFEWTLGSWAGEGGGPGVCTASPRCGGNLIMEHNGDVYSCDHFMYPAYKLGNILDGGLRKMVRSRKQTEFGASKETALPGYCRGCDVLFACRGGCPKHRFESSPRGEPGLNALCPGLKKFYRHVRPSMDQMVQLLRRGMPVERIMEAVRLSDATGQREG